MKEKMKSKWASLKNYYKEHPKRFWVLGVFLILVIFVLATKKPATTTTVINIGNEDLKQTVLATGQVTSKTDLNLSFSVSGLVNTLPVEVGDNVRSGQILATLENENEYASLKSAQAKYKKVLDGSSNEEIAVAQTSLDSAKSSLTNTIQVQDTLVENARRAYLNNDITPSLYSGYSSYTPIISGVYTGTTEGEYRLTFYGSGTGVYVSYSGIESGSVSVNTTNSVPLGTKGLEIQLPSGYANSFNEIWTVALPNKKSSSYITTFNAYQNALKTRDSSISAAQTLVTEREANLALKKASARQSDVDSAAADVLSAQATYEKTVLRAPASGTVVHIDTKIGERVDIQKEVIVIQDVGNLYVEANINETNIAKVVLGQKVTMTLDAFGRDTTFDGEVIHIDPSSTTTDGVVNYKIKVSIADATAKNIRPGMNANMTILAWDHPNVIAIPKAAVLDKEDGTHVVQIVTDDKNDKFTERVVTLGQLGDGNKIEVLSGLSVGEKIAITSTAK